MQLLEAGTNRVLLDLTGTDKLYDFTHRWVDAESRSYRRGDMGLVANDGQGYKAELRFELRRLTRADVDALESVYRERSPFICVPDRAALAERAYLVRWVSGFERRDTVLTDWSQGRSVEAVFREV